MRTDKEIKITGTDRKSIRSQLISIFLEEEPGTGKGDLSAKYRYFVETLSDGKRIFLVRPAPLNKGFDFEVHVEDTDFGEKRFTSMPSHHKVFDDLETKRDENPAQFKKVRLLIEKIHQCEVLSSKEFKSLHFTQGYPIETILKSIKWLFIEQDMTYWNWSGRNMLYSHLKTL